MTKPHNVDICVTCVSDKPPKLPLREELPSLGIEVVFNAHGVGAKASKNESEKLLKKYREEELAKAKRAPRFLSPVRRKQQEQREREENMLRIPKALSYQSYQRELNQMRGESTESSSSVSSWETNSTLESSNAENKHDGKGGNGLVVQNINGSMSPTLSKNINNKPPRTVEVPTHSPEELAIKEAFKIFSTPVTSQNETVLETRETSAQNVSVRSPSQSQGYAASREPSSPSEKGNSSRQAPSSGVDNSTLTTKTNQSSVPGHVQIVASKSVQATLPGFQVESTRSTSSSSGPKASSGPTAHTKGNSTLTTLPESSHASKSKVEFRSSPEIRDELPKLRFDDSSSSEDGEEGSSLVSSLRDSTHSSVLKERSISSIKMTLMKSPTNGTTTSEFYDLTAISDTDSNSLDIESVEKDLDESLDKLSKLRFDESDSASKDPSSVKFDDAESLSRDMSNFRFESESMSKDLSTVSSKREPPPRIMGRPKGVQVYPSPAIQKQLPGLRLQIPEVDDGFGRIVLDLSSVCEEDGHLSIVTSPNGSGSNTESGRGRTESRRSNVIHSPYKREEESGWKSNARVLEDRQDYDIMESPTYPTRHTAHGKYDYHHDITPKTSHAVRDGGMRALIDDASSKSLSQASKSEEEVLEDIEMNRMYDDEVDRAIQLSKESEQKGLRKTGPIKLKSEKVIHSPQKSYSQDSAGSNGPISPFVDKVIQFTKKTPSQDSSSKKQGKKSKSLQKATHVVTTKKMLDTAPLSPSLRGSLSRESYTHSSVNMKVSFSQDVEEHYYNDEYPGESDDSQARNNSGVGKFANRSTHSDELQTITSYEDCFNLSGKKVESQPMFPSLLRDDTSTNADNAFDSLLTAKESKESMREDPREVSTPVLEPKVLSPAPEQETRVQNSPDEMTKNVDQVDIRDAEAEEAILPRSRPMPSRRLGLGLKSRKNNGYMAEDSNLTIKSSLDIYENTTLSASEKSFLVSLSRGTSLPSGFTEILKRNPELARKRLAETDLYPLHAACIRAFPDRFRADQSCNVVDLVKDVVERRDLIQSLVEADASRCKCLNKDGDLPVHLLARLLMEWEARWYQKVYEKARQDNDDEAESGVGITKLYQTMSQCIDLLLKPVSEDTLLCQREGSKGKLLPLHIAAIFTVSYDTLKALLEVYEGGANVKCNLESIRTFIPSDTIPLELHDRLSTDFPKWEIEGGDNEEEINWTQSALDKSYGTKGGMRRSDLMFAFNPAILTYRSDTARIRRLEARIRQEIGEIESGHATELSCAAQRLWTWMCTFQGDEGHDDNYVHSVQRIIQTIPARSVKFLASLPVDDGKAILDKALPECVDVIRDRLNEVAEKEIPVPMAALSTGFKNNQKSFILRQWEEDTASRFCLQGRGFVGPLCRTLFNIHETNFPTSFIFLPYRLVKDSEGRLGLESAAAAAIAMQFADCLLHLTDPKVLLHFLDKKSIRFLGSSLKNENKHEFARLEIATKEYINRLLNLYRGGPAYFYYLDEFNGVPIVTEDNSTYPLVVKDAVDMVRKVLPLMITGMTLMRGEKAITVLTKVILDAKIELVQNNWVEAAKDVIGYTYSPQTEWTSGYLQDLWPLRERLVDFVEKGPSENAPPSDHTGLASEWVVELSLVKMVVEMYDPKHTFAGMKPRRAGALKVLWTKEKSFLNPASRDHLLYIDFKSVIDLKEFSSIEHEEALNALRQQQRDQHRELTNSGRESPDSESSGEHSTGYELLFGELSLIPEKSKSRSEEEPESDSDDESLHTWERREVPVLSAVRRDSTATASRPISLLEFDDDLDLDDVLQLRILLDEQEAKLEFLKEKICDIEVEEAELLDKEEKLGEMLDGINNAKNDLLTSPSNHGLTRARNLLHRLCELEERVMCREVEVGQLKNEIACFELDASREGMDIYLFDDL